MLNDTNMESRRMNLYLCYIKSHCEAPDFEAQLMAENKVFAMNGFYRMLHGEFAIRDLKRFVAREYKNGKVQ